MVQAERENGENGERKMNVKEVGALFNMARSQKCRAHLSEGKRTLDHWRANHLKNIKLEAKVFKNTTRVIVHATVKAGARHNEEDTPIKFSHILDNASTWYNECMELMG